MKTRANNIQLKFQNRMYLLDQLYGPKVYYVDKYIYIYIYIFYIYYRRYKLREHH